MEFCSVNSVAVMSGGSQYIHAEKYESSEVKLFAKSTKVEPQNLAFLTPAMKKHLESAIPDKKVLDIGCGSGNWCYKAAQYGPKSVDGFDIQEDMVQLAKQVTSQFNMVNIHVGDVIYMPYDDNTFDVALSFYVTCGLRLEACISHFTEMYRVLAMDNIYATHGLETRIVVALKYVNDPCNTMS